MSSHADDGAHLPAEVESQLDRRLAVWASARRLGSDDLSTIRAQVLARVSEPVPQAESEPAFDSEWLWSLLRPVTALVERTAETGEANLSDRIERWLQPLTGDRSYRVHLRLA